MRKAVSALAAVLVPWLRGMRAKVIIYSSVEFLQGSRNPAGQRQSMHSKGSTNSLNASSESGQCPKQPAVSPIQTAAAEPAKEKILHASDAEGIKAEGQAAALAAIAAAQAQVNGHQQDDSRGNSGEYWVRSNSEEDLERADSGGLQVFVLYFLCRWRLHQ